MTKKQQGSRRHWAVPKFYDSVFLFVGLTTLGTFIESLLVGSWTNYRMSNFVYHHCGCSSIYHTLSYPDNWLNDKKIFREYFFGKSCLNLVGIFKIFYVF